MCFVEFPNGWIFGHYISKCLGLGLHWKDAYSMVSFPKLSNSDFVLFKFASQKLKLKSIFEGRIDLAVRAKPSRTSQQT